MDSLSSTDEAPGRGPDLAYVVIGEVAGVEPKAGHFFAANTTDKIVFVMKCAE